MAGSAALLILFLTTSLTTAPVRGTRNGKRATYIPCLMLNEFISCTANQAVLNETVSCDTKQGEDVAEKQNNKTKRTRWRS